MMLSTKKPQMVTSLPGPKSQELMTLREKNVPKGVSMNVPTFIKSGAGAMVEDVDGNVMIDFAGGIGVLNIGYSHPEVVEAVKSQTDKFFHAMVNVIQYEQYALLAEEMNKIAPVAGPAKTMFVSTGAEADENAIKIARRYTGKTDVIAFEGAFHGRTLLTMALTSKVKPYKYGFGPFPAGIHHLPYAYCYRCPYGLARETCNLRCAERIKEAFLSVVDPDDVAAIIVEPIQGEGGFILPPNEFLLELRALCDKHNIVLIVDEIQSGFYRTGKRFALEHVGIKADIVTTAKSLAGGIPLAAVTGTADIMDSAQVGGIGGTYGGNPIACSAALKIIEVMERDDYSQKASVIGEVLVKRFQAMQQKYEIIGDVRGRGAMVAIELVKDRSSKLPAKEETANIIKEANKNGLILLSAGILGNVIRVLVPLVITDEQLNCGLDILEASIKKYSKA
jgi:4-aminobutyrate aminotransferase/(S)-3-amino-2-methylpropionate transaminase